MITCDVRIARSFLDDSAYINARSKTDLGYKQLLEKTGPGSEWLGWRDILATPNDAILEEIDALGASIRKDADIFIVCGIGGSYLGAKAVIDALSPHFGSKGPEILYAGHHMGGKYLQELIEYVKSPKEDGSKKSVYVNVISKSGSTLETALAFRALREALEELYQDGANDRIICTTSAEGGILNQLIEKKGYRKFIIPNDIGGRFSVLTPVGLVPIAVAGLDVKSLFYGAVAAYNYYGRNGRSIRVYSAKKCTSQVWKDN